MCLWKRSISFKKSWDQDLYILKILTQQNWCRIQSNPSGTQREVLGSCLDKWMNDSVSTMVITCTIMCKQTQPPQKKKQKTLAMNLTGVFFILKMKHISMAITLTCWHKSLKGKQSMRRLGLLTDTTKCSGNNSLKRYLFVAFPLKNNRPISSLLGQLGFRSIYTNYCPGFRTTRGEGGSAWTSKKGNRMIWRYIAKWRNYENWCMPVSPRHTKTSRTCSIKTIVDI